MASKKRPVQTEIAGTGRKVHKDISEAAEDYLEKRDVHALTTKDLTEVKSKLLMLMVSHGLKKYVDPTDGTEVEIEESQNVKVKSAKKSSSED